MRGDDEKKVLTASVRYSRSVTASPLKPWVAAEMCGTVVCCHCMCMTGLGEADRGLVVHPQYPHLGATPDGYVK